MVVNSNPNPEPNPTLSPYIFYTGEERLHPTEAERRLNKLKLFVN